MGVSYQQLRSGRLATHFDLAKTSLESCCGSLEELGAFWYSAEAMARLGRKALHQIGETSLGHIPSRGGSLSPASVNNDGAGSSKRTASSTVNSALPERNTPRSSNSWENDSGLKVRTPAMTIRGQSAIPEFREQQVESNQDAVGDGFADIDMLFDDFLNLSLPTNFWDPVFFPPVHNDDHV